MKGVGIGLPKCVNFHVANSTVILHPCDWHNAPFGNVRATPTDGKPVSMFANQHEAFAIITKDIREAAAQFSFMSPQVVSALTTSQKPSTSPKIRSSNLRVKQNFSDHEKDRFLEDTFEYIARYFEGSLAEMSERNSHLQTRFRRIDANSFTAAAYVDGSRRLSVLSGWGAGTDSTKALSIQHKKIRHATAAMILWISRTMDIPCLSNHLA